MIGPQESQVIPLPDSLLICLLCNSTLTSPFACSRSLLMALLSIRGDWYLYLWLIYRKIYSAVIWLVGNHCRGDKSRAVISTGVGSQSLASLHRVRTRRRKPPQHQHRNKHIAVLVKKPSLRRTVMAPGPSTAHAMMEDKEKALSNGKSHSFSTV